MATVRVLASSRFPQSVALKAMVLAFSLSLFMLPVRAQQHDMSHMEHMRGAQHGDIGMVIDHESSEALVQELADEHHSEYNHHLAGLLVFLAGIFVLLQEPLADHWPQVRYIWPMCFLATGLFVFTFGDLEIWPLGPQTPLFALTHNMEAVQHKVFSAILVSLGYVEFQRARGKFTGFWSAVFFPVLAVAGATLLLFHVHGGAMTAPDAMKSMEHIEKQHHWFATAGFGIAITKALAEIPQRWQLVFRKIWPTLLTILGILLIVYTE